MQINAFFRSRHENKLVLSEFLPFLSYTRCCSGVRQSAIWFALITRSLAYRRESSGGVTIRFFAFSRQCHNANNSRPFSLNGQKGEKVKSLEVKAHPSRIVENSRYLLQRSLFLSFLLYSFLTSPCTVRFPWYYVKLIPFRNTLCHDGDALRRTVNG